MPAVTDDSPFVTLKSTIAAVVAWFQSASVRGVIIGGVANAFLGRSRSTRDVDGMVVLENDSQISPFLDKAVAFGIVPRVSDVVEFARVSRVLLLRHTPSRIDVDISCGWLPYESEVLDRSTVDGMLGFDVPLPTPEDLIVMKSIAHRSHDWRDIEGVIDAHPNLDVEYVLLWARRFAEIMEAPEIVDQLQNLFRAARSASMNKPTLHHSAKKQTVKQKSMPKAVGKKVAQKKAAHKKITGIPKKVAAKKKAASPFRKKSHRD